MDLRRRSKNRVAEAMARIVACLPTPQEPGSANCYVDVDRAVLSPKVVKSSPSY